MCLYKQVCQMWVCVCVCVKCKNSKVRGVLTNKGSVNKRVNGILVLQFPRLVTEAAASSRSALASKSFSVGRAFQGPREPRPFHDNGYKTPANISKHAGLLTSTTWPPAKAALM